MAELQNSDIRASCAAQEALPARPPYFSWTVEKVHGSPFALTAEEWNALCRSVNAVRQYRGLGKAALPEAVRGRPFCAAQFNAVRAAIAEMGGGEDVPPAAPGGLVTASALNALVNSLNSIN